MSKLVCTRGLNRGDEFTLHEGKNIIGRAADCRITLFDKKCSRNHCEIIKRGRHYSISDLNSTNGTRLNGKPLKRTKSLKETDRIRIGKTVLELSEKAVGGVLDQTASDVAAELQSGKYGKLLDDATYSVAHQHETPERSSWLDQLRSLFRGKR